VDIDRPFGGEVFVFQSMDATLYFIAPAIPGQPFRRGETNLRLLPAK
jgi:hypothetical protein